MATRTNNKLCILFSCGRRNKSLQRVVAWRLTCLNHESLGFPFTWNLWVPIGIIIIIIWILKKWVLICDSPCILMWPTYCCGNQSWVGRGTSIHNQEIGVFSTKEEMRYFFPIFCTYLLYMCVCVCVCVFLREYVVYLHQGWTLSFWSIYLVEMRYSTKSSHSTLIWENKPHKSS